MITKAMRDTAHRETAVERWPVGATFRPRVPLRETSFELAEQLARRGASERLIRAAGGEEAVEKLLGRNDQVRSA
jgi:hypothetical protein